jgi:hypothetical protein
VTGQLTAMDEEQQRRHRARRAALVLGAVALTFYVGFILMGVLRA